MKLVDRMVVAMLIASAGLLIGYMLGTADHSGKDAVMEQYSAWSLQEQQDFVLAVVQNKHSLRREIAEDWCAINRRTQRICWNARMKNPIRGATR